MKRLLKIVSVVVVIIGSGVGIIDSGLLRPDVRAEDAQKSAMPVAGPVVSVVNSVKREIAETIVINGTLVPRDEILVTPEIDGFRITDVLVEEGMFVERGQVLARLSRDLIDRQLA